MGVHAEPLYRPANGRCGPRQRGFTLIEIVVVVAIVGLVALISIPNLQRMRVKAKGTNALVAVAGTFDLARAEATKRHSPICVAVDWTTKPAFITVWEDWDPNNRTEVPFDGYNDNGTIDGDEQTILGRAVSTHLVKTSAPAADPMPLVEISLVRYRSDGGLASGSGAAYLQDPRGNQFRIRVVDTSGAVRIEGWMPETNTWSARKEDWEWKF
jgi:prepilin-type N-terminal cleavage/methylation domain-containing protein